MQNRMLLLSLLIFGIIQAMDKTDDPINYPYACPEIIKQYIRAELKHGHIIKHANSIAAYLPNLPTRAAYCTKKDEKKDCFFLIEDYVSMGPLTYEYCRLNSQWYDLMKQYKKQQKNKGIQ